MTQISSGRMCEIYSCSRQSSLNGRSSSTPSTSSWWAKLLKSLINISHRKFQSSSSCVRRVSTPSDNERTIDGFSIDTNRRGRILLESPAYRFSRFRQAKCFTTPRPTHSNHYSAHTSSRFRTQIEFIFFFQFSHSRRCVRAFGSRLCVSSNRFVWRQLKFLLTLSARASLLLLLLLPNLPFVRHSGSNYALALPHQQWMRRQIKKNRTKCAWIDILIAIPARSQCSFSVCVRND